MAQHRSVLRPCSQTVGPLLGCLGWGKTLPGKQSHALHVAVSLGQQCPCALQLQVAKILPVPRGGQQALERVQRCAVGRESII